MSSPDQSQPDADNTTARDTSGKTLKIIVVQLIFDAIGGVIAGSYLFMVFLSTTAENAGFFSRPPDVCRGTQCEGQGSIQNSAKQAGPNRTW